MGLRNFIQTSGRIIHVNDVLSLFSRFYGTIEEPELSSFIAVDRYIDGLLPLRNTQNYANFTLGGKSCRDERVDHYS